MNVIVPVCVPVQISASEVLIVRTCHLVSMFNESIIITTAKMGTCKKTLHKKTLHFFFSLSESDVQIWKHVRLKIFWTRECVLHSIFLDFSKGYMTTWLELVKKSQLGPPRVKRLKNTLYYSLHGSNNPCKLVIVF